MSTYYDEVFFRFQSSCVTCDCGLLLLMTNTSSIGFHNPIEAANLCSIVSVTYSFGGKVLVHTSNLPECACARSCGRRCSRRLTSPYSYSSSCSHIVVKVCLLVKLAQRRCAQISSSGATLAHLLRLALVWHRLVCVQKAKVSYRIV